MWRDCRFRRSMRICAKRWAASIATSISPSDVGQIRAIQVYVAGEARRPGVYTVSSLSTLVDALFASGGPSVEGSMRAHRAAPRGRGGHATSISTTC